MGEVVGGARSPDKICIEREKYGMRYLRDAQEYIKMAVGMFRKSVHFAEIRELEGVIKELARIKDRIKAKQPDWVPD